METRRSVSPKQGMVLQDVFMAWMMPKEIWAAIKTRFGGNANSKKMQKAVLKQQFEAFTISSKESLEKGYDRFQKLLSQLDALGASVSDEDANHKFLRSLPPAWDTKASSSKHKPHHNSGSYSSYTTSSSKATPTATPGLADEVNTHSLSYNALKAKYDELQSEFGDQEAALTAHKIGLKKVEAQLNASHKQQISLNEKLLFQANQIFEKDEKLKKYRRIGMKAVKDKDALQKIVDSWFASSKNLWKLIDCGMSSTVKLGLGYSIKSNAEVLSYEEEMDRGIFASIRETDPGYHAIPLYSRFKQVENKGVPHPLSGDYTPREQEDIDDSLYEYGKYGPQPQTPNPTVSNASSIVFSICPSNDSDGELGVVCDASSTHYSTCQSNDSDGELGTVTDLSVNDDSIPVPSSEQVSISTQKTQSQVPTPPQTVDPSCAQHVKTPRQPIRTPVTPSPIPSYNRQNWNQRMERELGAGSSFERKPCFVCGSLSHLIKDCDYYEKKMAREAALKSKRVVNTNDRQATPAWNNTNRINKANQFTPRPVNVRPNLSTASNTIKTGRVNGNTGNGNINSDSVHVNAGTQFKSGNSRFNTGKQHVSSGSVHVNAGTQFKSGNSRFNTGKQHVSSGSVYVNSVTQFKSAASRVNTGKRYINSGCVHINTARVNRPMFNKPNPKPSQVKFNRSSPEAYGAIEWESVTFGEELKGSISVKVIPTSAAPTPTHHVSTPSSSHVQITQPQSPPPPITATPPPQPPPTINQSSSTPPQPSSVQPTLTTPPIQPVETTSSPPMFTIPDTQPTPQPSPQVPSPSYHDTEGPSFEPSYHMSPPPSHEPEFQASRSSEESEQLRNLMDIVPRLESRVKSLEKELSETKQTLGTTIFQLTEKVKKLENKLRKKRKNQINTGEVNAAEVNTGEVNAAEVNTDCRAREEAAREALATEFDYIQARLNADQILAEKIQQEKVEQSNY
ncbi:hypothetical protein Tco_0186045 [Tanacetum coccineum]